MSFHPPEETCSMYIYLTGKPTPATRTQSGRTTQTMGVYVERTRDKETYGKKG